jgi:ribosomal protein S18 acetylase RimI-like enzyme
MNQSYGKQPDARDMKSMPSLRPAKEHEAVHLAVLMDIASRGLVSWYWSTLAPAGEPPMEIGRARIQTRNDLPSHFSRWTVAENEREIVGASAGYMIPDPYNPGDVNELPEVYAPLLELETQAAGCWFLMSLSVYPEFRHRGIGSCLLRAAISQAQDYPASRMALTVSSENSDALALYVRSGFSEAARRRYIAFPGSSERGDWILLTKELFS